MFGFSFSGSFFLGCGEYSEDRGTHTISFSCTTGGVHSLPVQIIHGVSMRLPTLILIGSFGKSTFECVEVERIELDGIKQCILLLMVVTVEVITNTVFDGCWVFQDLIRGGSLLWP